MEKLRTNCCVLYPQAPIDANNNDNNYYLHQWVWVMSLMKSS